jgi:hypothetical protein
MSTPFSQAIRPLIVATLLLAFGANALGCATANDTPAKDSAHWPATILAFRDAIEVERARLKDFVSRPAEGSDGSTLTSDDLIAIADRLARLQTSLEQLEADASSASEPSNP